MSVRSVNEMPTPVTVVVRVRVPDRPGALGLVASRIGSLRGDIVAVDVRERVDGVAVDEFAVRLTDVDLIPALVREIQEVDGTAVEDVHVIEHVHNARLFGFDAAVAIGAAADPDDLAAILVERTRSNLRGDWCVLARGDQLLATAGETPAQLTDGGEIAVAEAELPCLGARLVVGRSERRFGEGDRAELIALARVADRIAELMRLAAR